MGCDPGCEGGSAKDSAQASAAAPAAKPALCPLFDRPLVRMVFDYITAFCVVSSHSI